MKSGFAAIIGRPNVGKSTLLNAIAGQKIAITSNKPQTTRNRIRAIHTDDVGQIIFIDTPGMISKAKNKLGEYMIGSAKAAIRDADVILYLVEPSSYIGKEDEQIIGMLSKSKKPVILVINKIDTIPYEQILTIIDTFNNAGRFDEIFPISALRGNEVPKLLSSIMTYLSEGPMYYDPDSVTDSTEREIVSEMIREKSLHALKEEIPHGLAVYVESMETEESEKTGEPITNIKATIVCERNSHKAIIIGKGGSMLKKIGSNARFEIERMLGNKVFLELFVKVRKDWRDDLKYVRDFGYDTREL